MNPIARGSADGTPVLPSGTVHAVRGHIDNRILTNGNKTAAFN